MDVARAFFITEECSTCDVISNKEPYKCSALKIYYRAYFKKLPGLVRMPRSVAILLFSPMYKPNHSALRANILAETGRLKMDDQKENWLIVTKRRRNKQDASRRGVKVNLRHAVAFKIFNGL